MATLSSSPACRARVADRARVDLALGALEVGDHLQRLDLRRAGDRAGRERGAHEVRVGRALAHARGHVRDEMPHAGVRLGPALRGGDRAVARDAPEVVAREVDDHHVLGRVLGGGEQRVRARLARGGALDRRGDDLVPGAAQEQLGREADDGGAGQAEERAVRRVAARRRRRGTRRRRCPRTPPSSRRVTLAWNSSPAAIRSTHSATAARWRPAAPGAGASGPSRKGRGGAGRARRSRSTPSRRSAASLGQRLEPPRPVGVLAQHVVVVAERRERQRPRPRRGRRQPLDRRAEPEAQVAEPAAADRPVRAGARRHVEHVQRRGPLHHPQRLRADDRARARPAPGPARTAARRRAPPAARPRVRGRCRGGSGRASTRCSLAAARELSWGRPADVAQLVEHFTRNEGVSGSSPLVGFALERRPGRPGGALASGV